MSWLSSFFGKKNTTTTSTVDPKSQAYQDQMRQQAQNASNVALNGPNPQPQGGFPGGVFGGAANRAAAMNPGGAPPGAGGQPNSWFAGPQTMSIGDQAAQFMNPYMSNVVDATRGEYDRLRAGAMNQTSQQATQSGAYGGSRAAVLAGSRLGALDQGQASTIGNLMNSGYQNAMSQGTQYAEQQRQLREQQLQEPLFRQQQAQQFQQNGMGPVGQQTTQTSQGGGFSDLLRTGVGLYTGLRGAGLFGGGQQQQPNLGMGGQNPNIFQGQYPGQYGQYR